jgi:hypothetical protein
MTADAFRKLALGLPEAVEQSHMCHPDFRVGGKIFATIWPDEDWAMVKLTPALQRQFVELHPKVFEPLKGAWGARGCTQVRLSAATKSVLWPALIAAWRNTAPKKLVRAFDEE